MVAVLIQDVPKKKKSNTKIAFPIRGWAVINDYEHIQVMFQPPPPFYTPLYFFFFSFAYFSSLILVFNFR